MKEEKLILSLVILLILFVTGIGYGVEDDSLLVENYNPIMQVYHKDFDVVLVGESKYLGDGIAEVEITGPRTANFNITELNKVGDCVTVILTLENRSNQFYADINAEVFNSNTEYFNVTSKVTEKKISPNNGKSNIEINVELIKLPIYEDEKSNISLNIYTNPSN